MAAAENVTEPSTFTEEMYDQVAGLGDFLKLVQKGKPWQIPTERLIRLNGNSRRGKYVNHEINEQLKARGLVCQPAVETADYYGTVVVSDPRDGLPTPAAVASLPISVFRRESATSLIACGPDMPAKKVQALMISHDYSQLPVLSGDKKSLYGVVTWKSIAQHRGNRDTATSTDIMGPRSHVASSSDDFLELVETIISQEYVLYRTPDGCVDGIVTASDLANAFNGTAGIYIQLQELENRLRILLDRSSIPTLKKHLDPKRRAMKSFRGATDMTFGEYLQALADTDIWQASGIDLDQQFCLKLFDAVRDVRNGVMHFRPGVEGDSVMEQDDERATVMRALRVLRATP